MLWTGYASYYLCRMNFAVAQPMILEEFTTWTNAQVGMIPSVYSIFYAIGQFINGQIGSRIGARRMMTVGLVVIGAMNVLFADTSSYSLMLVMWGINGYCQSIGWPLVVQTMSNWFKVGRRGLMMGLISTCYQGGNVLAWLLAGFLISHYGTWRIAFLVPGVIMFPVALILAFGMRDQPEHAGLAHIRDDDAPAPAKDDKKEAAPEVLSIWDIIRITMSSKILWILALSYFCFNAVRYAFMNWSIQYFKVFHGEDIKKSAFMAVVFPLIGSLGAISSGWASDRFFQSRRAPVCTIMLLCLAGLCLAFIPIPAGEWLYGVGILAGAGFMIYGPDAILTGAATIDLSHPKAAASATGFIMAMGNLGAFLVAGFGVGLLLDMGGGSWTWVFVALSILSVMAAGMAVLLWNEKPKLKKK
jgi:OPA family glycerol-3-phosphate transporter-like MFS transporter